MWGNRTKEDILQILYHQNGYCGRCRDILMVPEKARPAIGKQPHQKWGLSAVCLPCWNKTSRMMLT